jgi:hypothetical protein
MINDYRASDRRCAGNAMAMAGPLTPDAELADAPLRSGTDLQDALQEAGYAASRSVAITLSGAPDAAAAMPVLAEHHCRELMSPRYGGSCWRNRCCRLTSLRRVRRAGAFPSSSTPRAPNPETAATTTLAAFRRCVGTAPDGDGAGAQHEHGNPRLLFAAGNMHVRWERF